ncbi:Aldo/keto reductase [Lactarius akahatsu]|uniref:Aldo/keto reductase n=1 Tax=Lactarius akahatsu TaxID=416441 RepID=A0AAD4LD20_9AGAM|nr:Aldo/keto reductase [Lactarius akahatsu]
MASQSIISPLSPAHVGSSSDVTATHWETFPLGPFNPPRLWVGLWQLSSTAWGSAPAARIREAMARHVDQGYTAFDMVNLLSGQFQEHLPPRTVLGGTKWCVFKLGEELSRSTVETAVRERMTRMRTSHLDFLQFYWQDYSNKGYMTALRYLLDLQADGLITAIGLVNFDAARTDEICTQLGPGAIVSNQVQFSLIDTRPLHGMADVCGKHNIKLLTYGTFCGGFLADAWLDRPEPDPYSGTLTPSQRKYLDAITRAWGDWALFQQLLAVLRKIGDRHGGATIANVAVRWVLDHPFVGAVLVGTRLGVSEHPEDNLNVFKFRLSDADRADIEAVLDRSNGRKMITLIGDCGAEYR